MSINVSNCQHCDEQQFQTLSCVHYTIFSVVKLDLFIRALLLDRILTLKKLRVCHAYILLVYLNTMNQSIAIIESMFNFGKFCTKNAITFDLTELGRKKYTVFCGHEILMRIQCCLQKCQNRKGKINFIPKCYSIKS